MKVDANTSEYREDPGARHEFNKQELRSMRLLLRRLRFLEAQVRENGGLGAATGSGGAAFAEWEVEALAWILTEVGFLIDDNEEPGFPELDRSRA